MTDLISRQAAVDTVRKIILGFFSDADGVMTDTEKTLLSVNKSVCNGVRELPSAELATNLQPCNQDCISRQAAIDAIVAQTIGYTVEEIKAECEEKIFAENGYLGGLKDAILALEQLPSAQPFDEGINVPCTDTISRQAVLSLPRDTLRNIRGEVVSEMIDVKDIESLPSSPQSAQEESPWIPVSERLPEKAEPVLFWDADEKCICYGYYAEPQWRELYVNNFFENVTAWMPLPEPYAERRTDG